MGRRRPNRKSIRTGNRIKITSANVLGVSIGLLMVGLGVYHAVGTGRHGSYYIAALGMLFLALVVWGSVRKRR